MSFSVNDMSVRHGATQVLEHISLPLVPGKVTGLIGPNGVGKSSLLKAIAGILPSTGTLAEDGVTLAPTDRRDIVAYMPQDSSAGSSLTLTEVVLLGKLGSLGLRVSADMVRAVDTALGEFGLQHLSDRTLDAVSGGQRQLTYLAQAVFREPRILLLDEPTAALDLRHQLIVFEMLRRLADDKGIAVVVALHDLSLAAQFCDQVACLCDGTLEAMGTPQEVLTVERLDRVYGVEVDIDHRPGGELRVAAVRAV